MAAQLILQRRVGTMLSCELLAGEIGVNGRAVVDFKKGELAFKSEPLREKQKIAA